MSGDSDKSNSFTTKDWVTLVLSVLAFIISALSAYWTIIRKIDDVRIVTVKNLPIGENIADPKRNKWNVVWNWPITFFNLGNQPVAVTDVGLSFNQTNNEAELKNCPKYSAFVTGLVKPFTIEAGGLSTQIPSTLGIYEETIAYKNEPFWIQICGVFSIATPDMPGVPVRIELQRNHYDAGFTNETITLDRTPKVLFKKWSTIFSSQ